MNELINLIPKLIAKAYTTLQKGLYNTPVTTLTTVLIISSISFGSAYIALLTYVELNKKEAYVIFDNNSPDCPTNLK